MINLKSFLRFLFILTIFNKLFSNPSIFVEPGVTLFQKNAGFNILLGGQFYLKDLLKQIPDSFYTSIVFLNTFAYSESIGFLRFAFGLDSGYDFNLFNNKFFLTPSLIVGISYAELWDNILKRKKLGVFFSPKLEFLYKFYNDLRIGILFGYQFDIYDIFIGNFYISTTLYYSLNFLDKNKY